MQAVMMSSQLFMIPWLSCHGTSGCIAGVCIQQCSNGAFWHALCHGCQEECLVISEKMEGDAILPKECRKP